MPQGQRSSGRVRLTVPCEVKGSKEPLKVPVRDLSLDGIRLVSADARAVGDTLTLTLRLPARIELRAEVRWVEHEAARNHYVIGCRFVHEGESRRSLKDALQGMASAIDSAARRVK